MEENNITSQGEVNQNPESLLRVSPKMKESLLSSMNWIQFFVILCCFAVVIFTIIAIVMLAMSSFFPVENPDMSPLIMLGMGLLYLVVGVYPIVKGFKLIDHTRKALRAGTNSDFEASADDLHSIMKYCGWLTIISFVLYIIFMIAIVVFAAMSPSFLS